MIRLVNTITLAALGLIDFKSYKIPNVVLCGWLGTILYIFNLECTTPSSIIPRILGALIVTGSYIPLRRIVKCSAGDFKLFAVMVVAVGADDMLNTLMITLITCLFPLASGVRKVPVAFVTYFGYIAFLLISMEEKL